MKKLKQFLFDLEYTFTINGVEFDDLIDDWGVRINYDLVNPDRNVIELEYKEGEVKLSNDMENEIYDHLHSLFIKEVESEEYAQEIKETNEHLNRTFYGS